MRGQLKRQTRNRSIAVDTAVICGTQEKRAVLEQCDSAFTRSVVNGAGYERLFAKIDSRAEFVVARRGRECMGFAAMYANDWDSRTAYITLFAVRQDFQKQRVGTRLMQKCVELAEQRQMREIRLEVLRADTGPITFYRKMGFRYAGDASAEGQGSVYMCLKLQREITERRIPEITYYEDVKVGR